MFNNVLIVEDHESISISLRKTLEDLGVDEPKYVYHCDDAIKWIQMRLNEGKAYDLLITDLSFDDDGQTQQLPDGQTLIVAARKLQPELKVLVFSAENRAANIEELFKDFNINGYVRKARGDIQELKLAVISIYNNKRYFPSNLRQVIKQKNAYEFSDYDITIIFLLSKGTLQKDIPDYLQQNNIKPWGLSSIEKRLSLIKDALEFSKNEQLVAFCKDMGII